MPLALTRCEGERIVIGADVIVEVVEARGGKARLVVTAPPDVAVDREEVRRSKERSPRPAIFRRRPVPPPARPAL